MVVRCLYTGGGAVIEALWGCRVAPSHGGVPYRLVRSELDLEAEALTRDYV